MSELLSYDFSFLKGRQWYLLSEMMVECELRELTNNINHWACSLHRWQAWNLIISKYDDDSAWVLQREFLEAYAHECLLRPSAIRDIFTSVATNALHQARLSANSGYKDVLDGDPLPGNLHPRNLTRRKKEARLASIASIWPLAKKFLSLLERLDSSDYRGSTRDYRNLNSHTIGPRLGFGHTRTVTRRVVPKKIFKKVGDGCHELVLVPGEFSVEYDFGGTPPLDLEVARLQNIEQFKIAYCCYVEYRKILESISSDIPLKKTDA